MAGFGETVGVAEVRVAHAERGSLAVHEHRKSFLITADIAGECAADVVGAFDDEDLEEFAAGVDIAGFHIEAGGLAIEVAGRDGHRFVDIAGIEHAECGDDLLGAGHRAWDIGIFCVKHAAALHIEHERALANDRWWRVARDRRRCRDARGVADWLTVSLAARDGAWRRIATAG